MGVNLNVHYCHGEINSISFFTEHGTCVCDEVFAERMSEMTCCFDKNVKYEIDDEQLFSPFTQFNFKIYSSDDFNINYFFISEKVNYLIHIIRANPPPLLAYGNIPFQILFSVFRL